MEVDTPFIMRGYFKDANNRGSKADIELDSKEGFVEWRTRNDIEKESRPVYLLINKKCASSCDIFSIAIKEHRAAKILGTKTAGAVLGATAFKPIWKGFLALIPTTQVLSPHNKLYEGLGLKPDIVIPECDKLDQQKKCLVSKILDSPISKKWSWCIILLKAIN